MLSPPDKSILNFFRKFGIKYLFAISVIYGASASETNANHSKCYYAYYFLPLIHNPHISSSLIYITT